MGRTVLPFTQELYREEESWKSYRRALRREDRAMFDELFAAARYHTAACTCSGRAVPFEAILMSILLEERRAVRELSAPPPPGGGGGPLPPPPPQSSFLSTGHPRTAPQPRRGPSFVARRAVNPHGCALPHSGPPPAAAAPAAGNPGRGGGFHEAACGARLLVRRAERQRAGEGRERSRGEVPASQGPR